MSQFSFSTASLKEDESLLHLRKLEWQDTQCEGLECNHGRYKAVSESCHTELDNSDMYMLNIEFPTPINFVCKECVDVSGISSKLPTRKSSTKTILKDLAVTHFIARAKALRGKIPREFKDTERQVQVYK